MQWECIRSLTQDQNWKLKRRTLVTVGNNNVLFQNCNTISSELSEALTRKWLQSKNSGSSGSTGEAWKWIQWKIWKFWSIFPSIDDVALFGLGRFFLEKSWKNLKIWMPSFDSLIGSLGSIRSKMEIGEANSTIKPHLFIAFQIHAFSCLPNFLKAFLNFHNFES